MKKKQGLKRKLLTAVLLCILLSALSIGLSSYIISYNTVTSMADEELKNVLKSFFSSAKIAYLISSKSLTRNMDLAETFVVKKTRLDESRNIQMNVINQVTKEEKKITIPLLLINGNPACKDTSIVDEITRRSGSVATIFQVIPEGLLRISTTVRNSNGARASDTYIPIDSPVYQAIMKGESFNGSAFVVDQLYITAYKAIFDDRDRIIGAIFVGTKMSQTGELEYLRQEYRGMHIGMTGYPYIIDSKGNVILHPALEGKNIYDSVDANGRYYIREICSNKSGRIIYPWKNPGEPSARDKIVLYQYLPERDWIIAAGVYINELYSSISKIQINLLIIGLLLLGLGVIVALYISSSISKPIGKISENLSVSSGSLEGAAHQVSSSSQELSSGASELASSVEEMTSSLEELQSIIEANTKNINEAELLMQETNKSAKDSSVKMDEMQTAMNEINGNSKKIVKIIKVIDDIAFQTSILALNAAVEAARAGEAGRGFAVVAEQVKNLAQKSAEAVKETASLSNIAIDSAATGAASSVEVKEAMKKVLEQADKTGILLNEINRASKEQLKGANQVTKAVTQINGVVQGNAASSEETAAAGEELLSQSEMLKSVVDSLNQLIKGTAASLPGADYRKQLPNPESEETTQTNKLENPSAHKARYEWMEYKGHQVVYGDFGKCRTPEEMFRMLDDAADIVTHHPEGLLSLSNWTNALVSNEFIDYLKLMNKDIFVPKKMKSANIGVMGIKKVFATIISNFSGNKKLTQYFDNETEALEWLIKGEQ